MAGKKSSNKAKYTRNPDRGLKNKTRRYKRDAARLEKKLERLMSRSSVEACDGCDKGGDSSGKRNRKGCRYERITRHIESLKKLTARGKGAKYRKR